MREDIIMANSRKRARRTSRAHAEPTVFAQRLKSAMEERGWGLSETARRVRENLGEGSKFTAANISHYRQGRSFPRPRYLDALSSALGMDKNALVSPDESAAVLSKGPSPAAAIIEPSGASPHFHIEDRGGNAWLQINQQLPWPKAIQILQVLKGGMSENGKNG
jgi:transcriptional regulator with XRE-family HTH domain